MNSSTKVRVAGAIAAVLIAFGVVDLIAEYAYPRPPAVVLASIGR